MKIPAPCNAKVHYHSSIKRKIKKLVKESKIITQRPKIF